MGRPWQRPGAWRRLPRARYHRRGAGGSAAGAGSLGLQPPRIGLDIDDLRLPAKDALRRAAELQFSTIEVPTSHEELTPRTLSASGRRHFRRFAENLGLRLAAVTADYSGLRLTDPRTVDERVARTCEAMDLAKDVGVSIVTASVGALTHAETGEPSGAAMDALRRIGEYADSRGVVYALRPSSDGLDRLQRVFQELRCPSLRLGVDPAALVMCGVSATSIVDALTAELAIMHVRDATAGREEQPGHETPLGEGDTDWAALFAALKSADYTGPMIVRRCDSQRPSADLSLARERLLTLIR